MVGQSPCLYPRGGRRQEASHASDRQPWRTHPGAPPAPTRRPFNHCYPTPQQRQRGGQARGRGHCRRAAPHPKVSLCLCQGARRCLSGPPHMHSSMHPSTMKLVIAHHYPPLPAVKRTRCHLRHTHDGSSGHSSAVSGLAQGLRPHQAPPPPLPIPLRASPSSRGACGRLRVCGPAHHAGWLRRQAREFGGALGACRRDAAGA